ncbi:MAG: pyridoxine 5'-phosphate synthase [Candidatus Omnitrophota bacterium]|jgi:pyridoxine 5-phosphate synthase|nr:pyridoxine 5'-phosphate synthase [Candidatus Omnitrophota bacterium]
MRLGVNIDHIATLRQARRALEPEPAFAALLAEKSGADSIVVHLREDRRHINDNDLYVLRGIVRTRLNMEMSISKKIVDIACAVKPNQSTLVPEKREELTTEGGLDVIKNFSKIKEAVLKLQDEGIDVSIFVDPHLNQIRSVSKAGARMIELHTGRYANAKGKMQELKCLNELRSAAKFAKSLGMNVFAGHGLDYNNVTRVAVINEIEELNIGHSIVARGVFVGLGRAVKDMKELIN